MDRRLLGAHAAVPLALVVALAGCGTPGDGSKVASVSGTASPSASASAARTLSPAEEQERALKFAQCMREHGVDMPDPVIEDGNIRIEIRGKPGVDVDAAQQACREYAPTGPGGGQPDPQMEENMRKMAQCMRDNGVPNFPDPEPGGGIRLDNSVADDPDFEAAQNKCESQYMPGAPSKRVSP